MLLYLNRILNLLLLELQICDRLRGGFIICYGKVVTFSGFLFGGHYLILCEHEMMRRTF